MRELDVLLIKPPSATPHQKSEYSINLGLAYISSYLAQFGIKNEILDMGLLGMSLSSLLEFINVKGGC